MMEGNREDNRRKRSTTPGLLVISLDFELYWGVRNLPAVGKYFRNLVGARKVVPRLLDLFKEYGIHATWATVGFLFFDRTRSILRFAPTMRPKYKRRNLSPYNDLPPEEARENAKSIFFAPSLIRLICATAHQEIATHSFSHYYCLEEGQTIETFRQDLLAARAAARMFGLETSSLVFPKNQCRNDFLSVCSEAGIIAYRGNPSSWLYRAVADGEQGYIRRLGRLLDAYVSLSSQNCHPLPVWTGDVPLNIPSSRYLRPYSSRLRMFEPLRLRRIRRGLTTAAQTGQLYHLWWHPHDFGLNMASNFAILRRILDHYRSLRELYGMESLNMREAADRCLQMRVFADVASEEPARRAQNQEHV